MTYRKEEKVFFVRDVINSIDAVYTYSTRCVGEKNFTSLYRYSFQFISKNRSNLYAVEYSL